MNSKTKILDASRASFNAKFGEQKFISSETYIPPLGKVMDADDCASLIDASLDMWLTSGRFAVQFEPARAKK